MNMKELNVHQFLGRLTADPKIQTTSNGKVLMLFDLAYNTGRVTDETGSHSNFLAVEIWDEKAVEWKNLLRKGMQILIKGELYQRRWSAQDGSKRSKFRLSAAQIAVCDLKYRPASEIELAVQSA